MSEQQTPEQKIEALEAKLTAVKVRVFDLAEANEEVHKAYQSQGEQMQGFVTAVAQIVGMELGQEVKLEDVLKAVHEKVHGKGAEAVKDETEEA